ncbi:biotin carboxylase (plasmid) [Paenibacillus peoriae]|uniref:ATP-binding protein n=1 Tax=Paenibacillus peoriae TaxID=59893 RepID=UPI00071F71FC|nr:ATP-binding protein [Paenibacillus peoriae]ALS09985.1 biotin carboxylase [Paenibacillus peoriae]
MNDYNIPKRLSAPLINSFTAGVVPRVGLEHVAVGRKPEIEAILHDMENISAGGAAFRLITGPYGSGKSFMLQMIRNNAMDRNFAVADADLTPERRLVGSKGQGLATYRELISHLSTKTRPDGGALETVLQKWILAIQQRVMQATELSIHDEQLNLEVEKQIVEATEQMQNLVHGFDFAKVITAYWKGHKLADDVQKKAALRWLKGEYATKTEARRELQVSVIIDDDNWYDYIKLWGEFVIQIGYQGLLIFIDEGVNLYKITNAVSRQSNYEKLLTMFNDTMQGKAQYLGIFIGGTPQFVEDERRGLFSYEALRSRLIDSRFSRSGYQNLSNPILKLEMLSHEEILLLLRKLTQIYSAHYGQPTNLSDDQMIRFMQTVMNQLGAEQMLTTREIVRDYMDLLHTLRQNTAASFDQLLTELTGPTDSIKAEGNNLDFADFEL